MNSGIGNRRLMQALGRLLSIEDVKQAPARLKTDELIPVVNVEPAWSSYETWSYTATVQMTGESYWSWDVAGRGFGVVPPSLSTNARQDTQDKETVIMGMAVDLAYDAAGLAADAGVVLSMVAYRYDGSFGILSQAIDPAWVTVGTAAVGDHYYWSHEWGVTQKGAPEQMISRGPIWVPEGCSYGLTSARLAGGSFPANTTLTVTAFGVQVPKGCRPPGI